MTITTETLTFKSFKNVFQSNFTSFIQNQSHLFLVNVSKDELWNTYLLSFPEENGIRQSFNCNSCRQFIKNYGNLVVIQGNSIKTIWEFQVEDPLYQHVIDNLSRLVTSAAIRDVFVTDHAKLGVDHNHQQLEDGEIVRWDHFYYELPSKFVTRSSRSVEFFMSDYRGQYQVMRRSLEELVVEATETVLELIAQNSLYRGEEFKAILITFLSLQKEFKTVSNKGVFCWINSIKHQGAVAKIRNTSIGTLLVDISAGVELDVAVTKFEKVMAPTNYKRPKAIFTKKMVEEAEATINDLGLSGSLGRRFAVVDDITVNNLLFVDRSAKPKTASIFDDLKGEVVVNPKKFSKIEEVHVDRFISDILPTAQSVEVLLENRHGGNLVSFIAPVDVDSPSLFKWDNGFSWSYSGALADSMKEKVKSAGGKIEGLLRCSLEWYNYDDLDLHLFEPSGRSIYYGSKRSATGGELDVDMNASGRSSRTPVENIIYPYGCNMPEGDYKLLVNQFSRRENQDYGFSVEIEYEGEIFRYEYDKLVKGDVTVAEFNYSHTNGLTFKMQLNSTTVSKELWNLQTNKFHKVNSIMFSPNHWDGQGVGNKHLFFMIKGAENKDPLVRGFFNEFLKEELMPHKRVFEAMAGKMNVDSQPFDNQLSGIGFSATQRSHIVVRVKGRIDRMIKVVL